ncbi:glycoside hydrolase family 5 protein [Moniliophthora roreri MCA 2997]|uniref:glucan 1,3-beta-glucosidase n=1 Tax=Moniliophthora roreri (strain MCA 2997) TaxID=1381753 RepID=V2WWF8_MONRO|nr:glycoside hydrolase family 5 protein [Moniliophthora roreri MCA 2997]
MTHSFLRTVTTALCGITLASSAAAINPGFPYGSQKVRGVNLGGWLVLEPWITPSLFEQTGNNDIIDEWTFGQLQDRGTATNRLRQHWDTWITEQDFRDIAAAGLNHVRIPIGYWAFQVQGGEPYIQGQLPYLQRAVGWAAANNLKVIVDLHGAPGSQNGFDNSGQKKDFPGWHSDSNNVRRTNDVIKQIADLFKDNTNVVPIIAPLNEPAGFYGDDVLSVTRQFWLDSYGNIRFPYGSDRQSDTVVLLHDAFQPLSYWQGFETPPNFEGVAMDKHIYQMFSIDENRRSDQEHINVACNYANEVSTFDLWTIIGEWTPAATDCAKYLNGRGVGSRYDGSYPGSSRIGSCQGKTGSASSFSNDYKNFLRQYWEAQVITYEKGEGWIQWTWKAENADEWSYQAGLRNGWIPQNPSERRFPGICG